ncbi:MAG: hypothetical protein IJM68_00650 [Synergistaceae bacterium]|nr:hypothetical protein [Synergistaceae bacterium]
MSKENVKPLEALVDVIIIRTKITEALKVIARRKVKEQAELDKKLANTNDEVEAGEIIEEINGKVFECELIKRDFDIITKCCHEISGNLRKANTIWPEYMGQFVERRVLLDKAADACWEVLDELQYIAEAVYGDKDKFTSIDLEIDALFHKIKKIQQADNRFLPDLKDSPKEA